MIVSTVPNLQTTPTNTAACKKTDIQNLPKELLQNIIALLNPLDVANLQFVSRGMRSAVDSLPVVYIDRINHRYKRNYEENGILSLLKNSKNDVGLTIEKYKDFNILHVEKLTNVEYLLLLKYGSEKDKLCMVDDPKTPDTIIRKLATSNIKNSSVKANIALKSNTPEDLLRVLAKEDFMTRGAVALNPNTPEDLLLTLKTDEDKTVRLSAENNLTKRQEIQLI